MLTGISTTQSRTTLLTVLTLLASASAYSVPAAAQGQDVDAITGEYSILEGYSGGEQSNPEELGAIGVTIAKNVITTLDKDGNELYVAEYELDTSSEPWQITMTARVTPVNGQGTESKGLIHEGDGVVTLIYALPGGDAPDDFVLEAQQNKFVLQREGDI